MKSAYATPYLVGCGMFCRPVYLPTNSLWICLRCKAVERGGTARRVPTDSGAHPACRLPPYPCAVPETPRCAPTA